MKNSHHTQEPSHNQPTPAAATPGSGFYVAVLVSESCAETADYEPLFEESFVLIRAGSEQQAKARAEQLGREAETSYRNDRGELITWQLKQVLDVSPLVDDRLADGSTLYARHFRDYASYARFEPLLEGSIEQASEKSSPTMPDLPLAAIDTGKTLEQLEQDKWAEPNPDATHLIQTVHRLRQKPLQDLSAEDCRIMIGQAVGLPYLLPVVLERLQTEPFLEGDYYPGDVLTSLLRVARQAGEATAPLRPHIIQVVDTALAQLDRLDGGPHKKNLEALLRQYKEDAD